MGKSAKSGRGSTSQQDSDEDALFKLGFVQALDDPVIEAKLVKMMKAANKEIADGMAALRQEVKQLKEAAAQKDATISELRGEIHQLQLANDSLEQYGRRSSLRVSGIREEFEDTTDGVLHVVNDVMKLEPPLEAKDINISHRLKKPRGARPTEPRPVIVRFMSKTDRNRVISQRRLLNEYNDNHDIKLYINEDLTTYRAKLFGLVRKLQKRSLFSQCWTFNGNIKVKDTNGNIKSVPSFEAIKELLPNVDIESFN